MKKLESVARIIDFFIPTDVVSSVLLIFAMENILDHVVTTLIPGRLTAVTWVVIYVGGLVAVSVLNYLSADDETRNDLEDDIESL